jgi:acyl carrier protein
VNPEICNWLVGWFASRGKRVGTGQDALQIDYLQPGLLTSLEIVELVAAIEDHYAVQFSEADMQDARFSTIGGMSELIAIALNRDQPRSIESEARDEASKVG